MQLPPRRITRSQVIVALALAAASVCIGIAVGIEQPAYVIGALLGFGVCGVIVCTIERMW